MKKGAPSCNANGPVPARTWLKAAGVTIAERPISPRGESGMAKGEQKSNRETKKPKKEKIKTIAAAPSQKAAGWQPNVGNGKKK